MSARIEIDVLGVGLVAPGLNDWASARPVLTGEQSHVRAATVVPPASRLPAAERRRAGLATRVALAVADAACAQAQVDPAGLATVFTSSSGDGTNCHLLCEALAEPDRVVSPTRFTNSVHNAPAGYWHIAVGGRQASTSVCAFDDSLAAGLTEALMQVAISGAPVLLVASDSPYPQPLQGVRPLSDAMGVGLVLAPARAGTEARGVARWTVTLGAADEGGAPSGCVDAGLEALRLELPTARVLPLLQAMVSASPSVFVLPTAGPDSARLIVGVTPGGDPR